MTDHGAFVLVNVYGPAISTEESAEERYAFKLRFYEVQHLPASPITHCWRTGAHVSFIRLRSNFSGEPQETDQVMVQFACHMLSSYLRRVCIRCFVEPFIQMNCQSHHW